MPDENGYPTEQELNAVRDWTGDADAWFALVRQLWGQDGWGWSQEVVRFTDNGVWVEFTRYNISTGGWSGNEDLIAAMEGNYIWFTTWESSRRGGHYVFELPMSLYDMKGMRLK